VELPFVELAVGAVDEAAVVLLDCFTAELGFEDVKVSTSWFEERSVIANYASGINHVEWEIDSLGMLRREAASYASTNSTSYYDDHDQNYNPEDEWRQTAYCVTSPPGRLVGVMSGTTKHFHLKGPLGSSCLWSIAGHDLGCGGHGA